MLSIVIPAYNEKKTIAQCLESLTKQATLQDFEVIVVDNASTDNTSDIAKKFKKKLNLKLIQEPLKGRGQARFTGFKHAEGSLILSLDADAIAPQNWIEKMLLPFNNPKVVAVTGTGRIEDCSPRVNKSFNTIQPMAMLGYRLISRHFWLTGFNFAIRSDVYKKTGGFNPLLKANEDIDLAIRVAKLGKIKFLAFPITVSGRRVKNGLVKGMLSYVPGYIQQFAFKNPTDLSDIR